MTVGVGFPAGFATMQSLGNSSRGIVLFTLKFPGRWGVIPNPCAKDERVWQVRCHLLQAVLKKPVHGKYAAFHAIHVLSAALLAGICAGLALTLPAFFWAGLLGSSFLLAFLLRKNRPLARRTPVSPFLLAALFFAGGLRAQLDRPHWTEKDLAYYNGRGVQELIGWVSAPADLRAESTLVRVRVESIQTERGIIPVHGDALLRLPAGRALKYGDCLTVWGKPVTRGMETFSYREYLARQAIYTYFNHPQIAVTGSGSGSSSGGGCMPCGRHPTGSSTGCIRSRSCSGEWHFAWH